MHGAPIEHIHFMFLLVKNTFIHLNMPCMHLDSRTLRKISWILMHVCHVTNMVENASSLIYFGNDSLWRHIVEKWYGELFGYWTSRQVRTLKIKKETDVVLMFYFSRLDVVTHLFWPDIWLQIIRDFYPNMWERENLLLIWNCTVWLYRHFINGFSLEGALPYFWFGRLLLRKFWQLIIWSSKIYSVNLWSMHKSLGM